MPPIFERRHYILAKIYVLQLGAEVLASQEVLSHVMLVNIISCLQSFSQHPSQDMIEVQNLRL